MLLSVIKVNSCCANFLKLHKEQKQCFDAHKKKMGGRAMVVAALFYGPFRIRRNRKVAPYASPPPTATSHFELVKCMYGWGF